MLPTFNRLRGLLLAVVIIAISTLLVAVPQPPAQAAKPLPPPNPGIRVATFNALGHSHTTPTGDQRGRLDSSERTRLAVKVFDYRNLDVIALQEFQPPQQAEFRRIASTRYGLWCPPSNGHRLDNCVAWDRDRIRLFDTSWFVVPYWKGQPRRMPLVHLQVITTGRVFAVTSVHNPSNWKAPAGSYRRAGWTIEEGVVEQLDAPTFSIGDRNDPWQVYAPYVPDGFHPAGTRGIDFIVGSRGVRFRNYHHIRTPRISRATDHPLTYADATLPRLQPVR